MDLTDKSQLVKYLKQNNLWAKKSLGQNFLIDRVVLNKIVETAELKANDTILEIGPGLGVLTKELAARAGKIIAIEKDDKTVELLKSQIAKCKSQTNIKIQNPNKDTKLKIIRGDFLDVDIKEIVGGDRYKVVANIPYYITAKILERLLTATNKPEIIVLLVQREVAERICAKPGKMSLLSVAVQLFSEPTIIKIVKATSFFPEPKVESAIIKIQVTCLPAGTASNKLQTNEKDLFKIVKIGFHARRKTLLNNLMVGTNLEKSQIIDIIYNIGLSEKVRAQELSINQWIKLCQMLQLNIEARNPKFETNSNDKKHKARNKF